MRSFPIAGKQDLYGVITLDTTSIKTFPKMKFSTFPSLPICYSPP
ncbi:MAG: hypothetical protein H6Q56_625 [Deltaproteobacteria bacterium]|jgi:hypothetical protein|nr:hypothetical protein [Deltaproteobacteria bacterium]